MAEYSYTDWHIHFKRDHLTLHEALDDLARVSAAQQEIPLMMQLVENPKYKMSGFTLFHGAVDLAKHDSIHIILGRELLEIDEAFTIGFTMGSTNRVSTTEENLFSMIAQYFYPKVYKFDSDEIEVFKNAIRLGYISGCMPLDEWDFTPYMDTSLREIRRALGIEYPLLLAYYEIEKHRYPQVLASQRLLDD